MAKEDEYIDLDNEEENNQQEEDRGDYVEDDEEGEEYEEGSDEEPDDGGESEEEQEDNESDDEDDDEDEVEEKSSKIKIPKYRLDQEIEKNKALREREQWLEEQLTKLLNSQTTKSEVDKKVTEEVFDFDAAEDEYIAAIIEGDSAAAKKIRKQIDTEKEKLLKAKLDSETVENSRKFKEAREEEKFQNTISNFESKYPFFNPTKKVYNEEAVDTVNTLMAGFIAKGLSKSEALEKAVSKVLPMYHKEPAKEKDTKRVVDQRKKNVQTMKKTPPKISGKKDTGAIPDVDVNGMDEKEFAKMTKDKRALAKLRGDIL